MSAIFWKELRENLAWAGVIFLGSSAALIAGLWSQFGMGMSIVGRTFLTLCMLVYPAAGLALGLVQVFQDSRKGRWQFITHRPMSTAQFLLGKWAAGVLLYVLATGIPLLIVIGWVAVPGHVPGPFAWDMVEPVVAHLLSGLMWYAGGFLVAGRSVRWMGSRVIPIGGALAGAFAYNLIALTLMEAVGIILVVTLLMLVGAWGVFAGDGETAKAPWWTRPATGLMLAIGWLFVIGCGMGLGETAIRTVWPIRQGPYRMYRLDREGQVQISSFENGKLVKTQDLAGHELHGDVSNRTQLESVVVYLPDEENSSGLGRRIEQSFMRPESHVTWIYPTYGEVNWFYLSRSRIVEGYDRESQWYVGSIGPEGFAGPQTRPSSFSESMADVSDYTLHSTVLRSTSSVFQLDLEHREARKIFSTNPGDPVRGVGTLAVEETDKAYYVVATQKNLHLFQFGKPEVVLPIEQEHAGNMISVGVTLGRQFIVGYRMQFAIGSGPVSYSVYGLDGKLVSHTDLPSRSLELGHYRLERFDECSVMGLLPPLLFAVVLPLKHVPGEPFRWELVGILVLVSIGWAGVMFGRLRAGHAGRGQIFLWVLLAGCLGLSGVLVGMSMLKTVRGMRCLKCGRRRLISESRCVYCDEPAEGPAMEGIEILAVG